MKSFHPSFFYRSQNPYFKVMVILAFLLVLPLISFGARLLRFGFSHTIGLHFDVQTIAVADLYQWFEASIFQDPMLFRSRPPKKCFLQGKYLVFFTAYYSLWVAQFQVSVVEFLYLWLPSHSNQSRHHHYSQSNIGRAFLQQYCLYCYSA